MPDEHADIVVRLVEPVDTTERFVDAVPGVLDGDAARSVDHNALASLKKHLCQLGDVGAPIVCEDYLRGCCRPADFSEGGLPRGGFLGELSCDVENLDVSGQQRGETAKGSFAYRVPIGNGFIHLSADDSRGAAGFGQYLPEHTVKLFEHLGGGLFHCVKSG